MYIFGIKEKEIHKGYLTTSACAECSKTEENEITISCRAFVLGPIFWPWVWFAWGRKAFVTCNNCKKYSTLSELKGKLKEKAEDEFLENKIPKTYFIIPAFIILKIVFSVAV
jgi:hypothetical protein